MLPIHSHLAFGITTSSTGFYALASLSYELILILSEFLVMYLFKYIFFLFRQLIEYSWLNDKLTIYDLTSFARPMHLSLKTVKYRLETSCNEFHFQKLHENMYHTTIFVTERNFVFDDLTLT